MWLIITGMISVVGHCLIIMASTKGHKRRTRSTGTQASGRDCAGAESENPEGTQKQLPAEPAGK